MKRRTFFASGLAMPFSVRAETAWPTRPVRIVVPFNPGGAIDALARVIGDALAVKLGQQMPVDPRPGANTIVGSEIVAKAAPDGFTFLITTNSTHTNNPSPYARLPFDPAKDLDPVSLVSLGTILVVAKADAPFNDLKGMSTWVKGLGRPATYGSWGIGSSGHLHGLMLEKSLGGLYSHVPYRGDVPALQDVANGDLDLTWASPASARTQLVAGFDLSLFVAAYAPAGTPAEIVGRMQRAIASAIGEPAVTGRLIAQGQTPVGSTPEELAKVLARETPIWADLIRQSGAKVE